MYMNEIIDKALATNNGTAKKDARKANMEKHIYNFFNEHERANEQKEKDNGGIGKAFEIACQSIFSSRTNYAKQGKNDKTMLINGKRVSVEIKTNGGRLDDVTAEYVIYGFDICNSTTKGKRRVADVILVPRNEFFDALNACGAIKEIYHDHKVDGHAIQPSKKAWFEWVSNYPVKWNPWQ